MKIIRSLEELYIEEDTAVAIGKFDGIHLGHQALLKEILKAKEQGLKAAVFTFTPSPAVLFGLSDKKTLMTDREKRLVLEKYGIDYLIEYPLNKETAAVDPLEYIEKYLVSQMHVKYIAAGPDLSFGKFGKGNFSLLQQYSKTYGYRVKRIAKICLDGEEISSSRVRNALVKGDMKEVKDCLGDWYSVEGDVLNGKKLGKTLGFPTLNLIPEEDKLLPPYGVYFSFAILDGKEYAGVTNIGKKPTVQEKEEITIETFLLDYSGNAYGKTVKVKLVQFARPEEKFANIDALKAAIDQNVQEANIFFRNNIFM